MIGFGWLKDNVCKEKDEVIEALQAENKVLKQKLNDKQQVINDTNAFWKRKIYNLTHKKSKTNSKL